MPTQDTPTLRQDPQSALLQSLPHPLLHRRLLCTAALGAALALPGAALAADDDHTHRQRRHRPDRDDGHDHNRRRHNQHPHARDNNDDDDRRRRDRRHAHTAPGWRDNRRYPPPRGIGPQHNLYRGDRLPAAYLHSPYLVHDWRGHHLSAPPLGHQWVQIGGDYALIAIATGLITTLVLARQ